MAEFITRGSLPSKTTWGAFHCQHLFGDLFLSYILFLFVCEGAAACIWRPEDDRLESTLSFPLGRSQGLNSICQT